MTFNIITLGCKVNQYESQVMTEVMLKDGFTHSQDKDHADIFIVNTCTVTSVSDSKNRKLIRRIRRNNENAIIVVTGCMSQAFPEDEVYEICDIVVGNTNRKIISKLIKDYVANSDHYVNVEEHTGGEIFEPIKITNFEERTRAQIKIEDGCNRFCAYCIIPYARGRVRSKDINELKEEATDLASKGFREIVLVGINLSCFGQDTNLNLCDAVETEEEFQKSLDFVHSIKFAKVHTFSYSRRKGTVGDKLPNQVDPQIKSERSKKMIEVTLKDRKEFLRNQLNNTYSVLFERKKEEGYWEGYTMNYTPVRVFSDLDLNDKIVDVKLTDAFDDYCIGELI